MSKYRTNLPQLSKSTFLTDGGLETTLVFHQNIDLPHFAAFDLYKDKKGTEVLKKYYLDYIDIAKQYCSGFILESATWRANPDWVLKIGYSLDSVNSINRTAIKQLENIRNDYENEQFRIAISGCIGPRGDGYFPNNNMNIKEAEEYHSFQIKTLAETNADFVTAMTMNYNEECIGIVKAAKKNKIPVVISYTVETDGNLPSGQSLCDAITSLDKITGNYVSYFMINCAHPNHFKNILQSDSTWTSRIKSIRANASTMSHAELDESEILNIGNKEELAIGYQNLKQLLPNLNILGGCCGTDHTHMEKICELWFKE